MAARKKAGKSVSRVGVIKTSMTVIKFKHYNRIQEIIIRPRSGDDDEGDVTVVADCGSELTLSKAVAKAAALAGSGSGGEFELVEKWGGRDGHQEIARIPMYAV